MFAMIEGPDDIIAFTESDRDWSLHILLIKCFKSAYFMTAATGTGSKNLTFNYPKYFVILRLDLTNLLILIMKEVVIDCIQI